MRLYEFRCLSCRHEFEDLVRNDNDPVTCPQCQSTHVARLLSAVRAQGGRTQESAASCAAPSSFS